MNAKRLLCTAISTLLILLTGAAFAQPVRQLFRQNPFSRSRNVCGMGIDPTVYTCGTDSDPLVVSSASLYSGIEQGDFRPGHGSSSLWKMGAEAQTEGYFRKTFMTGSFSFEELHGKDMRMSMFINPGYYPIDVLEFTPGDKTLQTYRFSGGIAHELSDGWRLGGKIDFASQNYAKRKDIRHTNYALDLTIMPSILYRGLDSRFGLSGIFRKTSESIEAEQVGAATADTYYAFFDKGMRYGTYQAWDGSGIHLAEAGVSRLPVREFSYGAAVQYAYVGGLYVDAEYLRTDGLVGERGYDWYRFPGHRLAGNLRWSHLTPFHYDYGFLTLHFDWRGQRLEEAAWDKVTDGGITLPEVYGYNTVYRRRQTNLSADYQILFRDHTLRSVQLGYSATIWDEQASPQYPYTDCWHIWMSRLNANIVTGLPFDGIGRRFTLALGARYFWASDRERGLEPVIPSEGSSVISSEVEKSGLQPASEPYRLIYDWDRRHEYLTASGIGLNGSVIYRLKSVQGLYLCLDASWTHAFEITFLNGKNRWTSTLRLGYDF